MVIYDGNLIMHYFDISSPRSIILKSIILEIIADKWSSVYGLFITERFQQRVGKFIRKRLIAEHYIPLVITVYAVFSKA